MASSSAVGSFVSAEDGYGYPDRDAAPMPEGWEYRTDDWLGVTAEAPGGPQGADWQPLGRACAQQWKAVVQNAGGR